ncbi:MAG TPA: HAMP domain-containing sensor histidine kinase [Polyangiaceae bacterium]|nr:HAMP domain-containing sensor histidine kinase [Polyangiaceae bacterium]
MRLRTGLAKRIVVGAVLCGIIGYVVPRATSWRAIGQSVAQLTAPVALYTFTKYEQPRCEAEPSSWSGALAYGARVYAYDAATLTSHNPDAPPLDVDLWREVLERKDPPVAIDMLGMLLLRRGTGVLRVADSGPCAIVQAVWPPQPITRDIQFRIGLGMMGTVALTAAVALAWVVRPLVRRIEALRRVAERVGDPEGYRSAGDSSDDEIGELSGALDRAHARIRDDAARLEQRRRDLQRHLADVAHDLKTPISSLHIALEQAGDANRDPELTGLLSSALHDAVYLAALTSNLRLASEMREGYDPGASGSTVDLTETVERVVARARFFAKRKGIDIESAVPDAPTIARCDPVAAEQALSNVVENAITHGDRGGHVAVVLDAHRGAFALSVVDDGPGVPPAELPRLGERTFRSDEARQRDPRGSGLGLAITSEVCTRCGWQLGFDREEPRGLRVTLHGQVC